MTDDVLRHAVVVGVDGSVPSLQAVRWAAPEAARRAVPLLLLHSAFVPSPEPSTPVDLPCSYREAMLEQGAERLTEAEKVAREAAADVVVCTEQRMGPAAGQLLRLGESAALLVVGSRGLGAVAGLPPGPVATDVAAHARCPVVVVRGRTPESGPPRTGPVVVGVDGTAHSAAAVGFAFEMAAARRVPLVAVHAVFRSGAVLPEVACRQLRDGAARHPEAEVREHVVQNRATGALLEAAEDAWLVVAGSRGRGGFTGLTVGSTSQSVLRRAPCPVAIVRPGHRPNDPVEEW